MAVFIVALFIYFIGIDLFAYGSAYINYKNGDYVKAINQFMALDGFLDSSELLSDSLYLKAEKDYEKNPEAAISVMISLGIKDFKDSKEKSKEYVYQYAFGFFVSRDYQNAIKWFSSIDSYKDSKEKRLESHYMLSKDFWDQKQYKDAMKNMEVASFSSYKDSKALLQDYRYNYAIILKNSSFYKEAIDIFNLIPNYKDTLEQLKSSKYGLAMHYYNIKQYEEALTWFNGIKGYKDTNSKITYIENIIYAWNVTIYFNTSETSSLRKTSISKYSPVYMHFEVSGGKPNDVIKLKLVYTLPNGTKYTQYSFDLYNGGSYWLGWEDGIYTNPYYGATGNIKVSVYNSKTGKLLGSGTVRITE